MEAQRRRLRDDRYLSPQRRIRASGPFLFLFSSWARRTNFKDQVSPRPPPTLFVARAAAASHHDHSRSVLEMLFTLFYGFHSLPLFLKCKRGERREDLCGQYQRPQKTHRLGEFVRLVLSPPSLCFYLVCGKCY